jgi:hypothetical protein
LTKEEATAKFWSDWNEVRDTIRAKNDQYETVAIIRALRERGWVMDCINPEIDVEVHD